MKVILLQDVAKIGRKWEVVNVPDGHALNMLIPKKWALPASPKNLKDLENKQGNISASAASRDALVDGAYEALKDATPEVVVETNEQGHLFAAVKGETVVKALGHQLDVSMILIKEPIKSIGEHQVFLLKGKTEMPLVIRVVSQK